jgi:tRNA pseudouridine55 synthase
VAVYAENGHILLGTAHVIAGELIPGRLLSPIEIEQIANKSQTKPSEDLGFVQTV